MSFYDWSVMISFTVFFIGTIASVFFIIPRYFREVWQPKDGFTQLRWALLTSAAVFGLAAFPALLYRLLLILELDTEIWRGVTSMSTALMFLAGNAAMYFVVTYKRRDK